MENQYNREVKISSQNDYSNNQGLIIITNNKDDTFFDNINNHTLREKLFYNSRNFYNSLISPTGRFYHFHISDVILCGLNNNKLIDTFLKLNEDNENVQIISSVQNLWHKPIWHSFIVGEGGMGKTVSILYLWENYLKNGFNNLLPIPIFIALNEYNVCKDSKKRNFILYCIGRDYLGIENISEQLENEIFALLRSSIKHNYVEKIPNVLLLLDGLNEITVDKNGLLIELKDILKRCDGIQILITSRTDIRNNLNLQNLFNKYELSELTDKQIKSIFTIISD